MKDEGDHGFLPLQAAKEFCRWEVSDIRFNELNDEVDCFVVLESPQTFQEAPKSLYFKDQWAAFQTFHSKNIHAVVNFTSANIPTGDTWVHERFTRNALSDQALAFLTGDQAPSQGDVLVIGDIDEVPRPTILKALHNCAFPPRVTINSDFYYYYFQWLHRQPPWPHPQATFYNGPSYTIKPEDLRPGNASVFIHKVAWQCSSCKSMMRELFGKIESFSHKAYNHPYILNKENRERFKYMLDRDPPDTNFQDLD